MESRSSAPAACNLSLSHPHPHHPPPSLFRFLSATLATPLHHHPSPPSPSADSQPAFLVRVPAFIFLNPRSHNARALCEPPPPPHPPPPPTHPGHLMSSHHRLFASFLHSLLEPPTRHPHVDGATAQMIFLRCFPSNSPTQRWGKKKGVWSSPPSEAAAVDCTNALAVVEAAVSHRLSTSTSLSLPLHTHVISTRHARGLHDISQPLPPCSTFC